MCTTNGKPREADSNNTVSHLIRRTMNPFCGGATHIDEEGEEEEEVGKEDDDGPTRQLAHASSARGPVWLGKVVGGSPVERAT